MEINLNNLFHACDGQVSLKTLDDESLDVLLLFESSLNWNEYFYWTTNELSVSKVVLKMNFISKKNSSFFIPPCHPPYKSFSTRFSVVHTRSCFSNEIRMNYPRGGGSDRGASITRQWITYSQHPPSANSKPSFYSASPRLSRSFLSHERATIIEQSTSHVLIAQRSTVNWASRVYNVHTRVRLSPW